MNHFACPKPVPKTLIAGLALLLLLTAIQEAQAFPWSSKKNDEPKVTLVKTGINWQENLDATDAKTLPTLTSDFPDQSWWREFNDSQLEQYIQAALEHNPDLNIALARIDEARATWHSQISKQLPVANLSGSFLRATLPGMSGLSLPSPFKLFNFPFQASYELDLFGKYRDQTKAAKRMLEASEQDARSAQIMLCSEVASAYFNLLMSDSLVSTQKDNVALLTKIHALKQSQYSIGLVSFDEVIRADRDVSQAQTNLSDFQKQQALFSHELSVLTGSPPAAQANLPRLDAGQVKLPESIQSGSPDLVLTRRPDIVSAEKKMESARLNIAAARKAFLPSINLSAGLFFFGSKFTDALKWDNHATLQSVSVSQPFTDLYKNYASLNVQKARQKQQLQDYRRVSLNALKDVEDTLAQLRASYQNLGNAEQRQALTAHELELTNSRYQQGLVPKLNVLQGQSELIQYQQRAVQGKMGAAIATVNLYKAIGGGY